MSFSFHTCIGDDCQNLVVTFFELNKFILDHFSQMCFQEKKFCHTFLLREKLQFLIRCRKISAHVFLPSPDWHHIFFHCSFFQNVSRDSVFNIMQFLLIQIGHLLVGFLRAYTRSPYREIRFCNYMCASRISSIVFHTCIQICYHCACFHTTPSSLWLYF